MRKVRPDPQKAASLRKMAMVTLERLELTEKEAYPSNTLTDYYDIIHKLLEALAAVEGVKTQGDGAHTRLIDHACKEYLLGEGTRVFLQGLREYRNRIAYEGFMVPADYVSRNVPRIQAIIGKLSKLLEERLR